MQYRTSKKIIIDERKLIALKRMNCPDKQILDVIITGKFEKTNDELIDEILECLCDRKEFNSWGGNHNPKGINGCNKKKKTGQVDLALDIGQVTGQDEDINKDNVNRLKEKGIRGKPSREEVIAYCKERNSPVNPNQWFDYYQSNGWKVGKNPMKDWKACVRNWEVKERQSEEHPCDGLFHQENPTQEKIKAILEQRRKDDEERRKNIQEAERWTAFINKKGYKNTVALVSAGKEVFEKLKAEYRQGGVK